MFSAYVLGQDTLIYQGISFDFNYVEIFFHIIYVSTIIIFFRKRPECILFENNMPVMIRHSNRRACLVKEIICLALNVFVFVSAFFIFISLCSDTGFASFKDEGFRYAYILNVLWIFLIVLIQFGIEIYISKSFGFYVTISGYVFFLLNSQVIYDRIQYLPDTKISEILGIINKFNYTNYMSVKRLSALNIPAENALALCTLAILICIVTMFLTIRKVDIIDKE